MNQINNRLSFWMKLGTVVEKQRVQRRFCDSLILSNFSLYTLILYLIIYIILICIRCSFFQKWEKISNNKFKLVKNIIFSAFNFWKKVLFILIQSDRIGLDLLLSGISLFGQNFLTSWLFIIPIHVSIRKKYAVIRNLFLIRNKFNIIINFSQIY
jgi:hypothetical protein